MESKDIADLIMRWDWRDSFREGNKKAIQEMIDEHSQLKQKELLEIVADRLLNQLGAELSRMTKDDSIKIISTDDH